MPTPTTASVVTPQAWFHMDQMQKDAGSVLSTGSSSSNASIAALRDALDQVQQMLELLAQLTSARSQKGHSTGAHHRRPQMA
jgi:hypothetical protein